MKNLYAKWSRAQCLSSLLVALGLTSLIVMATARLWWSEDSEAAGRPSLVVDRTEVDLGKRQYDIPARATFTLTNVGDSALTIVEEPLVTVVKGC